MNLEDYLSKCEYLGLNRGQLAGGFDTEPTSMAYSREFDRREWGTSVEGPPPLTEDLSHLISKHSRPLTIEQKLTRCHPEARPLWKSLYERGHTASTLAKELGIATVGVHTMIAGRRGYETYIPSFRKLLTLKERSIFDSLPKRS